jgi:hypothetical protein
VGGGGGGGIVFAVIAKISSLLIPGDTEGSTKLFPGLPKASPDRSGPEFCKSGWQSKGLGGGGGGVGCDGLFGFASLVIKAVSEI